MHRILIFSGNPQDAPAKGAPIITRWLVAAAFCLFTAQGVDSSSEAAPYHFTAVEYPAAFTEGAPSFPKAVPMTPPEGHLVFAPQIFPSSSGSFCRSYANLTGPSQNPNLDIVRWESPLFSPLRSSTAPGPWGTAFRQIPGSGLPARAQRAARFGRPPR